MEFLLMNKSNSQPQKEKIHGGKRPGAGRPKTKHLLPDCDKRKAFFIYISTREHDKLMSLAGGNLSDFLRKTFKLDE